MSAITQPSPPPVQPPDLPGQKPDVAKPEGSGVKKAGLVLLGLVVAGGIAYFAWPNAPGRNAQTTGAAPVRTGKAVIGSLARTIRVSGQTAARNYAAITVPILRGPENRRDLALLSLAAAGSTVKAGDLIAELDPTNALDHIDDVNDSVAQAESDIRRRKAEQEVEWITLEQTLREAKADLDMAKLDAQAAEVRTVVEREILNLNAAEATARYAQMQADLADKKIAHDAELKILETTLQRQIRHRDRHVEDLRVFKIKAPMQGLVVAQQIWRGAEMAQVQAGDQVSPGQLFLKVVDPSSMQIEGFVNQAESSQFRIGQRATVGLDAFPEARFTGKVNSIGALAAGGMRNSNYVRNVPIRIAVEGVDARMIPDLSGWANVEIERQDGSLQVRVEAIHEKDGKAFVRVKRGKGFDEREVRLGLRNGTHVAVLSGIRSGDEVALERPN